MSQYSFVNENGKLIFYKGDKLFWKIGYTIEICDSPKYSTFSSDGSKFAFCGWRTDLCQINDLDDLEDAEEESYPITVVLDIENRKFLWVYEEHIEPLVWNSDEDELICSSKRYEGDKWAERHGLIPRSVKSPKRAIWENLAPGYDTDILERELDYVRHTYPWAEKSSEQDICQRVVDHIVNGKSYQKPQQVTTYHEIEVTPELPPPPAPEKKHKGIDNILVILSCVAICTIWMCFAGYEGAAIVGLGVLFAIIARLVSHYEPRFDRKFLRWRILFLFIVTFSSLTYQIAKGLYFLAGMPALLTEFVLFVVIAIAGRIKSRGVGNEIVAKRWAWAETVAIAMIIGAFVFFARINK